MIITRKYLSQYINIDEITNDDLNQALNNLGFEVEKIFNLYQANKNLVIGKVLSKVKSSTNEKYNFCLVDIGKKRTVSIVTIADNFSQNDYVIVALENSILFSGKEIKKIKIAGHTSEAMFCSLSELGINSENNQNQIFVFQQNFNYKVGDHDPLRYIIADDTTFEISLTYNRSDCYSAYELVKEIGAYFKLPLKTIDLSFNHKLINKNLQAEIKVDENLVLNSKSVIIKNINNKKSPQWLQSILIHLGIKTNNLITDLINYVTWEIGQPIIGFNLEAVKGQLSITNKIVQQFDNLKTNDNDLVIIDDTNLVEICGIKTNPIYEINIDTKNIILLSNFYQAEYMRQQQKRYNIYNLAIQRYTKTLNRSKTTEAIQRFLNLLKMMTTLDNYSVINNNRNQEINKTIITTTLEYQKNLLGISNLTNEKIIELLNLLGFQVVVKKNQLLITVPEARLDVTHEANISEEIARLYGYNNIPSIAPLVQQQAKKSNNFDIIITEIKQFLLSYGIYEVKTYSLTNYEQAKNFNFFNYKKPIKLFNALSENHQYLRLNLQSSLLDVIKYNNNHNISNVNIFEIANIYYNVEKSDSHLTIMLQKNFLANKFTNQVIKIDFYTIKGLLTSILNKFNLKNTTFNLSNHTLLHQYLQADVLVKKQHIATLGKINNNLKNDVFVININLSMIEKMWNKKIIYQQWNKFNSSSFHFSFFINKDLSFEKIKETILTLDKRIETIEIVDYYLVNKKNPSLTIAIVVNDQNQQITNDDVMLIYNKVEESLKNLKLRIRD